MGKKGIGRRSFLKTSAGAALGIMAGLQGADLVRPRLGRAQTPVRILNGCTFSGAYAEAGMLSRRGIDLALEHWGGKVLGRPIEIIERDVPTPADAVRKTKEVVDKTGCDYIIIAPASSTVLAVMEYAAEKKIPMLAGGASDNITGANCNKYSFRLVTPCWGGIRETVPRVIDIFKANTFYTITPKYVFGEDLLKATKEVLAEKGKKLLGNSYHPAGESEYGGYITAAMATKPDCVLFLNFSGDTVNSLKQAANFGMKDTCKICCVWGSGLTQMKAIGARILKDVIFGIEYFYKIDSPLNNKIQKSYFEKYKTAAPFMAAAPYAYVHHYLEVVTKAGTTDPDAVVKTWEGFETEGLTGKETWRACDHQCIRNFYTVKCKGPEDMKGEDDLADIIGFSKHFLPCDQTGCKL